MENVIKDILLIQSFNLDDLIEQYRLFFLAILPSMFILACLIEYFDRMDTFSLVKRAVISILILTSITSFYKSSIDMSLEAATEKLNSQKQSNILLMDMFSAAKHWDKINVDKKGDHFYKDRNVLWGTIAFFKYHMFDRFINDGFTVVVFFICKICFVILKVVYSLVYYLGYGLVGIPCLLYLFPTMGNVLRGGVLSYLWCLVVPHVLVFILSMIGSEINKGYAAGTIIGGSSIGTVLLFIMTLFIAFTPLIAAMILNGSGVSQAGGIIATLGGNFVMSLPSKSFNAAAIMATGGALGPKMKLAQGVAKFGYKAGEKSGGMLKHGFSNIGAAKAASPDIKGASTQDVSSFANNLINKYLEPKKSSNITKRSGPNISGSGSYSQGNQSNNSNPKFKLGQRSNVVNNRMNSNQSMPKTEAPLQRENVQTKQDSVRQVNRRRENAKISRPVSRNKRRETTH